MDHLLLKAVATTTTDLGEFEAVISTSAIDREKDIVDPAAMVDALQAWNRPIPLDWNHSTNPEDIVGHVNPEVRQGGGRRGPGIRRGRPRHRPRPARLATDEVRDDRLQLRLPDPGRWVV